MIALATLLLLASLFFTFAQCFAVHYLPFCHTHPLLRHTDGKYKFFDCDDSVASAEVDPWLGCQSLALPIASFAL